MKKVIRLTESDLMRIVKRVISEQEGGQKNEGGTDRDWWELDLKPKLKAAGFVEVKDPPFTGRPCYYKCCNYMYKGNHNTGTNVFLDCGKGSIGEWFITVYKNGNTDLKKFPAGTEGAKKAVSYALSLK